MLSNEFVWTKEATQAFENLKKLLTQTRMLHYPVFNQKFKVSTDASEEGIDAVLSQDNEKVDQFISRKLQPAEQKWYLKKQSCFRGLSFSSNLFIN
jgi:hypothetical protein